MDRHFESTLAYAKKLDAADALAPFRDRFYQIGESIYMDGNSLGLCSKDAEASLLHVLDVWKKNGILIWDAEGSRYYRYAAVLAEMMAPLVGADPNEICITGNTTLNIHQTISAFYHPTKACYKILVDDLNFPTDIYAVDSQVRLKGYAPEDAVKRVKSPDGRFIDEDAVIEAMSGDVALVLLPAILYRSSQWLDMARITREAHKRNIIIGWDLCHSIGAVPHDLKGVDADFAVWCTYKHLAGGPGATAGLYINKKHFDMLPGMWGWFGNRDETQFKMSHTFEKAPDASAWQTGTPNMFSMAPLEGVLRIFNEAGIERIREKSLHITAYLMYLIDEKLAKYGFTYGNPTDDAKRGGHVALTHSDAYRVCLALKKHKVIPDFREPDVIRLAPIALYNTYEEVYKVVGIVEKIMADKEHEAFSNERGMVV